MARSEPERSFLEWRRRGDPKALARVFDATAPGLLLLAIHLTRDDSVAEDLVQTTFLKAMEKARQYDRTRPLGPWLSAILRNEAFMLLRERRRRAEIRAMAPAAPAEPETLLESEELAGEVAKAIEALSGPCRQVLRLRLVHGLSNVEIAHVLGMPVGSVRSHAHRGLEKLRRMLPAGIASATILLSSSSAVEAMRARVLRQAAKSVLNTASLASVLGGVMVMKKLAVAAIAVAVLALAFVALDGAFRGEAPGIAATPELTGRNVGEQHGSSKGEGKDTQRVIEGQGQPASDPWKLEGRVTDQNGAALAGAEILVELGSMECREPLATTRSGPDGRYEVGLDALRGLSGLQRATRSLWVRAEAEGCWPGMEHSIRLPVRPDEPRFKRDLELHTGSVVRGRFALAIPHAGSFVLLAASSRAGIGQKALGELG
ncbi:MAG: sigma-70 family RNA polymerase sigma factor [Planctomycetota bacterium]